MSDLTFIERTKLERAFGMDSGYVLDFSNRTFAEFVLASTGRDIYEAKYDYQSGSKANRLRAFWEKEPNHLVGKLLVDLLEYQRVQSCETNPQPFFAECCRISQRLLQGAPVEQIDAIAAQGGEQDFEVLARAVRDSIQKNEPETGLDRLHTFVVRHVRRLCEKRGIAADRGKPLHSLFAEYVKHLRQNGLIESEMTERILKSSISTMEAFNRVRNERSLAHDNPMLNYDESLLIFNEICGLIRFVRAIETRSAKQEQASAETKMIGDDFPL